jgi:hypothetical protein
MGRKGIQPPAVPNDTSQARFATERVKASRTGRSRPVVASRCRHRAAIHAPRCSRFPVAHRHASRFAYRYAIKRLIPIAHRLGSKSVADQQDVDIGKLARYRTLLAAPGDFEGSPDKHCLPAHPRSNNSGEQGEDEITFFGIAAALTHSKPVPPIRSSISNRPCPL